MRNQAEERMAEKGPGISWMLFHEHDRGTAYFAKDRNMEDR
jgi:hypothetical protein